MSLTIRGHATGLETVPNRWRGPLPELAVRRTLRELDGWAMVPYDLAFGGYPDLAVLTWAWLRLRSDDRAETASYRDFAEAFGLSKLSNSALEQRFGSALSAMLSEGRWLRRTRTQDNQQKYQALVPKSVNKRYAMLRRSDIAMLRVTPARGHKPNVTATQLADFLRWQFECGRRGWTADVLTAIAARWKIGEATLRRRRDRLAECGLLEITHRPGGRFTDLVWLKEVYDPHWATTAEPGDAKSFAAAQIEGSSDELTPVAIGATLPAAPPEVSATIQGSTPLVGNSVNRQIPGVRTVKSQGSMPPNPRGPFIRNLTEGSLTEDLPDLGGASATPLTFVTRELADAVPQAAPRSTTEATVDETGRRRRLAGQLVAGQPVLMAAAPHWRSRMLDIIGRALDRDLEPAHLARALQRVIDDNAVERHCEIVRAALRQAWADQRAGMCPVCGADQGQHLVGCRDRAVEVDAAGEDEVEVRRLIIASLAEASAGGGVRPADRVPNPPEVGPGPRPDPLQPYLDLDVTLEPDASPEVVAQWLSVQIAGGLVDVDVDDVQGRRRALDRSVAWWASKMPVEQHQSIEFASAQLHFALSAPTRRAS